MQNEIIYIQNIKLYFLEEYGNQFKINLPEDGIKYVKNIEPIGLPFGILTENIQKRVSLSDNPFKYTPEFKELVNNIRIASSLEYYLNKAKIEHTLSKREENTLQNLGFTAGEALKNIVPCQFYLIKDNLII